jgi:hypothetical protein
MNVLPGCVIVPSIGRRMVCTYCGMFGSDVRPNWKGICKKQNLPHEGRAFCSSHCATPESAAPIIPTIGSFIWCLWPRCWTPMLRRSSAPPRSLASYVLVFPALSRITGRARWAQHELIRSFVENVTARARTIGGAKHWSGVVAFGVFDGVGAAHPSLHRRGPRDTQAASDRDGFSLQASGCNSHTHPAKGNGPHHLPR